jgi:hypothetical protein
MWTVNYFHGWYLSTIHIKSKFSISHSLKAKWIDYDIHKLLTTPNTDLYHKTHISLTWPLTSHLIRCTVHLTQQDKQFMTSMQRSIM